jgi:putative two-component system response regulator
MTTLSTMIEARDRYTEGHCHRMANHAATLGRQMGLSGEEIHVLRRGGFLHDIGMLAIPDAVLLKPSGLANDERALIQSHTVIGESLISNLRSLQPVRGIVRHHHERRDGSGYPDGLRGDAIPLPAQIVGLVDVFEAMTSPRPYQRPVSPREALAVLHRQVNKGWHREDLFAEFARIIGVG